MLLLFGNVYRTALPVCTFFGVTETACVRLWPARLAACSAVFIVVLGLTVLAGWFLHFPALIQFRPYLLPMTRNAAACFLLCGLALLTVALRGPRWLVVACAGAASAVSVLTIVEYAFGVNAGIDELLGPSYIAVRPSSPGRMAPVTTICFALGSMGLLLAPRSPSKRSALWFGLTGSIVAAIGIATTMKFALESSDAFGWGGVTRAAFHTGVGFWVFGFGMVALAWHVETDQADAPRWLPIGASIIVATCTVSVWEALIAAGHAPFALLPAVVLGGGCLMAPTFGLTVYLAQRAHAQAAALRRSEARKAAILDSALDCIVTIDHEGCITEFNPAAERTFGHRRDHVVGERLADVIIPPSLRSEHHRGFTRYLATGEARVLGRRIEMTAVRADGTEFPVELAIARIPTDGPPSFTGYLRDLTEQRQSEESLGKARFELAHVARVASLGTLAASIAHEVNQPLSGIITNAGTCLRMLAADPPNVDGARETAQRTIRDGNRAAKVIARLRALFAHHVATTESVDLNEATREVIALSASELQRSRVILRTELADDVPPVQGDRVQLQQVILNLLLNAMDAMSGVNDRPRQLVVKIERVEGGSVRLTVQDSGVGLKPQDIEKLFEAFYTTKSSGMGIGLSVSRSIIESHHGRLWAAPNGGPGATFAFSIPCSPERVATAYPLAVRRAPWRQIRHTPEGSGPSHA